MLKIQANEGREVAGFITKQGYVVFAPTHGNTFFESSIANFYQDADGRTVLALYRDDSDKYYVESPAYAGNFKYEVAATIHTHPPGSNQNEPSDLDKNMASGRSSLDHYFINNTHIVKFNAMGIDNIQQNQCSVYVGGN